MHSFICIYIYIYKKYRPLITSASNDNNSDSKNGEFGITEMNSQATAKKLYGQETSGNSIRITCITGTPNTAKMTLTIRAKTMVMTTITSQSKKGKNSRNLFK